MNDLYYTKINLIGLNVKKIKNTNLISLGTN